MTIAIKSKTLAWLVSDDTGVSSLTLCACFLGVTRKDYKSHPGDPSDFGRCKRFLATLDPDDKKCALQKVKELSPEWEALAENWDYLEGLSGTSDMFAIMQIIIRNARMPV